MQEFPVNRYRHLRNWLPFDRLTDKFYGVLVLASTTPLLVMITFLLLAPHGWRTTHLLLWTAAATLITLAASFWLAHGLLAPVLLARRALQAYRREQRLLTLPPDLGGEAGGLLNDLRATIETCERHRQIFADQADWAFRSKPSPLLTSDGAPRAVVHHAMRPAD